MKIGTNDIIILKQDCVIVSFLQLLECHDYEKTRIGVVAVLSIMLIPIEVSAATNTTKIDLSKSCVSVLAGNNLNGINGNVEVKWVNRILPASDRVTVTVPYCSVENTSVSIVVKSKNGKTYSGSKYFPSRNTKARLVVNGAFAFNTASIKVIVKGTRKDTGATSTWIVKNK